MAVLDSVRGPFRALASTIVPEAESLDPEGWARLEAIVDRAVARRPRSLQRQLAVFVRLLDLAPVLRWGRTFRRLDRSRRIAFLHRVQNARLFLFRRGFWGIRSLVYMGYYARPEAYDEIGYGARLRGWLEHPAAPAAARTATRAHLDGLAPAGRSGDADRGPGRAGTPPDRGPGGSPRERETP